MTIPNNGQPDLYESANFYQGLVCAMLGGLPLWALILWVVSKVVA